MSRYVKPRAGWIEDDTNRDDYPLIPDLHVPEPKPADTGLLWVTGEPIMRLPNPIGFGRDSEW